MTISGRTHTELMAIRDSMLDVLTEAAKHRHKREHVEGTGPHADLGWVVYEREQMTNAVNVARLSRGLPELTVDDIRQVEQIAEGHADYAAKFAFYCAELAMGIGRLTDRLNAP